MFNNIAIYMCSAYLKCSETRGPMKTHNVVFFGAAKSGKSSIILSVLTEEEKQTQRYKPLSGTNYYDVRRKYGQEEVKFRILDTINSVQTTDEFGVKKTETVELPCKTAAAGVLTLDSTEALTEEKKAELASRIEYFRKNAPPKTPLILVLTKCDVVPGKITSTEFRGYAKSLVGAQGITGFVSSTSVKNGQGVGVEPLFEQIYQLISGKQAQALSKEEELLAADNKQRLISKAASVYKWFKSALNVSAILLAIPLGFVLFGGITAALLFTSPVLIASSVAIGSNIGFILGAGILGSAFLASLMSVMVWIGLPRSVLFSLRILLLAGLVSGITASLIFAAAPAIGASLIGFLGLPMAIISLIVVPVFAALIMTIADIVFLKLLAGALPLLANLGILTGSSKILRVTQLFAITSAGLFRAALLGGLVAGIMFGVAPALMGAPILIAGNLALTISVLCLGALAVSFLSIIIGNPIIAKIASLVAYLERKANFLVDWDEAYKAENEFHEDAKQKFRRLEVEVKDQFKHGYEQISGQLPQTEEKDTTKKDGFKEQIKHQDDLGVGNEDPQMIKVGEVKDEVTVSQEVSEPNPTDSAEIKFH